MKINKQDVYNILRKIPKGKVLTYGDIGEMLGSKYYARTVGNILHTNPDGDLYPCYKVVTRDGTLSDSYAFGGINEQKRRLEKDGITVSDYRIDVEKYRWKV